MPKIKVLSREVSELIAAGEVIERPSSVIKELLENSIDSGANVITVEIKNGGRTYMRVTDNGCGIPFDDIPTAFLRHATSKISERVDLDRINTLGFRGEALASICAVSKVEVLTKVRESEMGTRYEIDASGEKAYETTGCPDGTTFVVRDIFYNVPARLKFLKKDVTEANAVSGIVSKLALSHPEISFKLIRDNKTELVTAGDGKIFSAVYSVFGRDFAESLLPVDYENAGVKVTGYTIKPLMAKPKRSFQNFFINNRYVKSVTCMVSIEEAYKNQIMTGKFPGCVLFINIDPKIVDVNVHPAKIEVKFSNEKLIYDSVYFAVKNALLADDTPKEMDLNPDKRYYSQNELYSFAKDESPEQTVMSVSNQGVKAFPKEQKDYSVRTFSKNESAQVASSSGDMYIKDGIDDEDLSRFVPPEKKELDDYKFINSDSFVSKSTPEPEDNGSDDISKPSARVAGEVFDTYVIVEYGEYMYIFDKHAAHERYLFEKIKSNPSGLETQMLLEPCTVLLSYEEYDAIMENLKSAGDLGFVIESDGAPNVAVYGLPVILNPNQAEEAVSEIAQNFLSCKKNPGPEMFDELYHSLACKAAVKGSTKSDISELQYLIDKIIGDDNIKYCPHGRPVFIKLSKKDLEKQFKRIV